MGGAMFVRSTNNTSCQSILSFVVNVYRKCPVNVFFPCWCKIYDLCLTKQNHKLLYDVSDVCFLFGIYFSIVQRDFLARSPSTTLASKCVCHFFACVSIQVSACFSICGKSAKRGCFLLFMLTVGIIIESIILFQLIIILI